MTGWSPYCCSRPTPLPGTPTHGVWVWPLPFAHPFTSRSNFEITKIGFTYGVDCAREFLRGLGVVGGTQSVMSSSNICVESSVVFGGVFF